MLSLYAPCFRAIQRSQVMTQSQRSFHLARRLACWVLPVRTPERHTFVIEYVRSTETLTKLLQKLRSYDRGLTGFPFEAVLIVTERTRRVELLSRDVRRASLSLSVLAANLADLNQGNFFESEFVDLAVSTKRKDLTQRNEA